MVEYIKQYWDKIDYVINEDKNKLHEANLLKLDCSKAHFKLAWKAKWNSEQTFEKTVNWYRTYYENNEVNSLDQLRSYIKAKG